MASVRLRITVAEVLGARAVADALEAQLADPALRFSDWSRENASYFRAIRLEKTMMALMLSLVIGVAAFNIVASLVMVVTDKETDIAILRTLGLSADGVVRVFFLQGLVIGWFGVILGVVGGTLLALNVTEVAALLERLAGVQVHAGGCLCHDANTVRGEVLAGSGYWPLCVVADNAGYLVSGAPGGTRTPCAGAEVRLVMSFETLIGRRYVRARSGTRFVSFISVISMLGVAIGITVLIVVLSVVNGFERELTDRLLAMSSHATIEGMEGRLGQWGATQGAGQ